MEYPSISEYIEAVEYAEETFETAELCELRPVLDANGRPMMTSGNFAVVFKMQNQQTGAEYALKCFTQDQEGRAEAYRQIMAELRYVDSPYFIDLEYIEEAVWAGDFDCAFPAVLMPWVDGEPLDQHIRRLVSEEPERLQLVAYKFSVMASWLLNQPFAHGDLKPGNILVRQDGSMVLVDYDGLYVPSMRGMTSREVGMPAFRHPNRVNMAFDEYIDDFALATINLSLYLIALKPSLLQTHGAKDRLLFSDDDYRNIAASRIIGEISQLSYDAQLQRLYALFLIALSEGSLQRCENRLMLLAPPRQEFVIERINPKIQAVAPQMSQPKDLVFNVNGVQFKMVRVEGGEFMMGATAEQGDDAWDDEKPAHRVSLDSYYIGETQVTQALWKAVMGNNPSNWKGDNLPVETISWNDCQEFIRKLNQFTGQTFALPTEAQWEFAARGGKLFKGYKYAGSDNLNEVAWFGDNPNSQTHPVVQTNPNELGLYDMSGNVWEWCNDWYDSNYYQSSPECNPQGPTSGDCRVLRGGSWGCDARDYRVSSRYYYHPDFRYDFIGVRLLLSLQPSDLVFDVNDVQFKMKYVEGGEFMMGATAEQEGDADDREKPAHRVSLDSFYIGETQVTQALWEAVMGNNSSDWKGENLVIYYIGETQVTQALWDAEMGNNSSDWKGENLPIETISWDDCQEFVKRLNKLTGKQFRLPTEAEWEYAARGGNRSRGYKYAGSNNLSDVAWFGDNSGEQTHPVAQKQSNELGLYDMSGNVWEWCNDWFDSNYYSSSPQHNPQGAMSGYCRVLRGGGLCDDARCCQVSYRDFNFPGERDSYYGGMRLSLSVL